MTGRQCMFTEEGKKGRKEEKRKIQRNQIHAKVLNVDMNLK